MSFNIERSVFAKPTVQLEDKHEMHIYSYLLVVDWNCLIAVMK